MKLISLILLLISSVAYSQHTSHYIYVTKGGDNGVFITSGIPLDTFVFRSSNNPFSYAYISVSGNSGGHITIINDGGQVSMTAGITLNDCNYVDVDGTGAVGIMYGFKIVNGSSVPLVIRGKSNYITEHNIEATNNGTGQGILWDKMEVSEAQSDHPCDATYLYPTHAKHHRLYNLYLHNSGGEGAYIGSTGSLGGRPYTCLGVTTFPQPILMGYIEFDHNIIDSVGRTGVQVSGCDSGFVSIHDNIIKNCGYELNPSQGAGIALGDLSQNAQVYNNTVDSTYFNSSYTYANNHIRYYNNSFAHSGIVFGNTNPQANAAVLISAHLPTTYSFQNNTIGSSTANTQIVIYQNGSNMGTPDTICNSGTLITNTTGVPYITSCATSSNWGFYTRLQASPLPIFYGISKVNDSTITFQVRKGDFAANGNRAELKSPETGMVSLNKNHFEFSFFVRQYDDVYGLDTAEFFNLFSIHNSDALQAAADAAGLTNMNNPFSIGLLGSNIRVEERAYAFNGNTLGTSVPNGNPITLFTQPLLVNQYNTVDVTFHWSADPNGGSIDITINGINHNYAAIKTLYDATYEYYNLFGTYRDCDYQKTSIIDFQNFKVNGELVKFNCLTPIGWRGTTKHNYGQIYKGCPLIN